MKTPLNLTYAIIHVALFLIFGFAGVHAAAQSSEEGNSESGEVDYEFEEDDLSDYDDDEFDEGAAPLDCAEGEEEVIGPDGSECEPVISNGADDETETASDDDYYDFSEDEDLQDEQEDDDFDEFGEGAAPINCAEGEEEVIGPDGSECESVDSSETDFGSDDGYEDGEVDYDFSMEETLQDEQGDGEVDYEFEEDDLSDYDEDASLDGSELDYSEGAQVRDGERDRSYCSRKPLPGGLIKECRSITLYSRQTLQQFEEGIRKYLQRCGMSSRAESLIHGNRTIPAAWRALNKPNSPLYVTIVPRFDESKYRGSDGQWCYRAKNVYFVLEDHFYEEDKPQPPIAGVPPQDRRRYAIRSGLQALDLTYEIDEARKQRMNCVLEKMQARLYANTLVFSPVMKNGLGEGVYKDDWPAADLNTAITQLKSKKYILDFEDLLVQSVERSGWPYLKPAFYEDQSEAASIRESLRKLAGLLEVEDRDILQVIYYLREVQGSGPGNMFPEGFKSVHSLVVGWMNDPNSIYHCYRPK